MSPWVSKEASSHEQEHDLSTFLSEKQRIELTLLITKISDGMRKKISDAFDASYTDPKEPINNPYTKQSAAHKETNEEAKARKIREHRIKELSESKQQELKVTALNHLHEWSASVLKRVTESMAHSLDKDKKPLPEGQESKTTGDANTTGNTNTIADTKTTADAITEEFDALVIQFYPPTSTTLYSLPPPSRILLLQAMLLLLLSLGHYTAPSRILLLNIASSLHIPFHVLAAIEVETAKGLVEGAADAGEDEITKQRHAKERASRRWKLILAAAAGVAVIGVSGGLLAPEVAAGLATVVGGWGLEATMAADLLGTLAESNIAVGAIFGMLFLPISYLSSHQSPLPPHFHLSLVKFEYPVNKTLPPRRLRRPRNLQNDGRIRQRSQRLQLPTPLHAPHRPLIHTHERYATPHARRRPIHARRRLARRPAPARDCLRLRLAGHQRRHHGALGLAGA